ncbi:MAG: ABC transporter permease [Candidatus Sumerlaeia bacterium]|nr:ABC transporter permease [Candidatus Sumerlaeia bacterium]
MPRLLRDTLLVARREAAALVASPLLYVLCGVFFLLGAFVFLSLLVNFSQEAFQDRSGGYVNVTQSVVRQTFHAVHFFLIAQIPLLTMRGFAEDRANGMLDLLRTTPLGEWPLVLGKFLGAFAAMAFFVALTLAFPLAAEAVSNPEWSVVASGWLALLLASAAYIAIGMFCSALTESQVVAAVLSYVALLGLSLLSALGALTRGTAWEDAAKHFGASEHIEAFLRGELAPMHIAYFALLAWTFLFLAARVLESQRWRS